MGKYRAAALMAGTAVVCLALHFYFGWKSAIDEAATRQQSAEMSQYFVQWLRDTFENLQSEFWQLAVQFALIAGFFEFIRVRVYEEDVEEVKSQLERIEAKLQELR